MERIKIITLNETDSTNRYMRDYDGERGEIMTIVTAEHQTAGRGQGENTWESEVGKNLTFSILVCPNNVPAARQFVMLEAKSLAIRDVLAENVPDITIKWPNDVYFQNKKISGTLSECDISGLRMTNCILGTGINVNQQSFTSDAPNPISLYNILGKETDRKELLNKIISQFEYYLSIVESGRFDEIDYLYSHALYRREGVFGYEDASGRFTARLVRVEPNGILVLQHSDGKIVKYEFKQVKFIINDD